MRSTGSAFEVLMEHKLFDFWLSGLLLLHLQYTLLSSQRTFVLLVFNNTFYSNHRAAHIHTIDGQMQKTQANSELRFS